MAGVPKENGLIGAMLADHTRGCDYIRAMNDSVETGREYVEADIEYVHYVEMLYSDAKAQGGFQGHHDE